MEAIKDKIAMKVDSQKIKQLRLAKSWSQEKLASQANITVRTVQRIENEGYASLRSLEALAKALESEPCEMVIEPVSEADQRGASNANSRNQWFWMTVVAVMAGTLLLQIYGSLMEVAVPVIIMLGFFPLCFLSIMVLASQYPLGKYRGVIYLAILPIGGLFAPPELPNQIVMMVICILMYEASCKAGAFFRASVVKI